VGDLTARASVRPVKCSFPRRPCTPFSGVIGNLAITADLFAVENVVKDANIHYGAGGRETTASRRGARSLHVLLSHRMTTPRPACTSDFDRLSPDIAAIASANMRSTSGSSCLELELLELELRNISV
jgi:hypothetical protein